MGSSLLFPLRALCVPRALRVILFFWFFPSLDTVTVVINDPDRSSSCPTPSQPPPSTTPSTTSASTKVTASTSSPKSPNPPSTSSSPTRPTSSPTVASPATPAKWSPSTKATGTNPAAPRQSRVQPLLEGISSFAGVFRPGGIEIKGSKHTPPGAHLVPELLEQMCDHINENWAKLSPLQLAAYALWRMNWIHPFVAGNGRTSRVVSYLVLCVRLGYVLPGTTTIPEQISKNKDPYYQAGCRSLRV